MKATEALKHWAVWTRQVGSKPVTCCSGERLFVDDPIRYIHSGDKERPLIFKPDHRIAEKVEKVLVTALNRKELYYLSACEAYGYALPFKEIAKRLGISEGSLETYRLVARNKFKGAWNG